MLAAVAALLPTAAPAEAETFVVVTTEDTPFSEPCAVANQCSLRSAIVSASANGEADVIQVPAGTYTTVNGDLAVQGDQVTIIGAGAGQTIISAKQGRVLYVVQGAALTMAYVTVRDGSIGDGQFGGNIFVGSQAGLTLSHARVTSGEASHGGGIGAQGAQFVRIDNSLIDGNQAIDFSGADGGGLAVDGATAGNTEIRVRNSTIASNAAASRGGGIAVQNNLKGQMLVQGVTVASNSVTAGTGGGLSLTGSVVGGPQPQLHVGGSIVSGNTAGGAASNCDGAPLADDGGNVESGTDCGLAAAGRQATDPQLSAGLVNAGGETPVLALAPTSPAIDVATCVVAVDQRDVARPKGLACDAGAYEYDPPPPPPLGVPPLIQPAPVPQPSQRALVPKPRRTVVVTEAGGRVLVRLPGTKRFVNLTDARTLPLGTVVNATAGKIRITSAANTRGKIQSAVFYGGIFKIGQKGRGKRLTTVLSLFGPKLKCPKRTSKGKRSHASKRRAKTRRLWGNGKGRFRTKGRYSSATVRGTKWLVKDSCKGTRTRVARGVVSVRDFAKRKNVRVKAGHSYFAKPRR